MLGEMCSCFYRYLSQKDWLKGARIVCRDECNKCGYGTLELIGKRDPTYDPNVKDKNLDKPLEELMVIFHNTPRATPVNLVCSTDCIVDTATFIHCTLTCPLNDDPRPIGTEKEIKMIRSDGTNTFIRIFSFRKNL